MTPESPLPPLGSATRPLPPIVLIHGLWMTASSWDAWTDHYQQRGHNVVASPYPGMDGSVEALNADPAAIARLDVDTIVDHYAGIVEALDVPPILIGHSFGGTFVQLLLDRGLGAAGIGISSSTVKGVLPLPFSTLRSVAPVLANPFNRDGATPLSAEQFRYLFTNTMSPEDSRRAYERFHVPAPNRVLFQGALANFNPRAATKVDFRNDERPPLLLIAAGEDHVIPPRVVRANHRLQRRSRSITAYREFSGRSHFIVGQDGWEEVADYALDWALDPKPGTDRRRSDARLRTRRSGPGD